MKLAIVFGTRPEAIKMAPIILEARRRPGIDPLVISTGQHREMLRPVLELFAIQPDIDLDLMEPGQTLARLTAKTMKAVSKTIEAERPDVLVVQGDTATAFVAALAAFYAKVPVAHVEAGLRSDRLDAPWPEEANRRLVSQITRWHLAPTEGARQNLLRDRLDLLGGKIVVTGNTVIDALHLALERIKDNPPEDSALQHALQWKNEGGKLVLITGHRRENFGEPFKEFCSGLRQIAESHPEALLLYPVHLNPNVQRPVRELLGGLENVVLSGPADYPVFVALMQAADVIVTDSGGVQEEAPALGVPVVVTRDVTERPEAVEAGAVDLVGPHAKALHAKVHEYLHNPPKRNPISPYGDGKAAGRCLDTIEGGMGVPPMNRDVAKRTRLESKGELPNCGEAWLSTGETPVPPSNAS